MLSNTLSRIGCENEGSTPGSADRKSTRLNSSHVASSYAVLCLKKKTRGRTLRHASQSSCLGRSAHRGCNALDDENLAPVFLHVQHGAGLHQPAIHFFFTGAAPPEISTLSLHDDLPI